MFYLPGKGSKKTSNAVEIANECTWYCLLDIEKVNTYDYILPQEGSVRKQYPFFLNVN